MMLWSVGDIVCEDDGSCRSRRVLAVQGNAMAVDGFVYDGSVTRPVKWDPLDPYALFVVARALHPRWPVVLNMPDPFDPDVKR